MKRYVKRLGLMSAALLLITIQFTFAFGAENQFQDMKTHWAKTSVEDMVKLGIFNGTSSTEFSPDEPMTRAMFVSALGRLGNVDVKAYEVKTFSDVNSGSWYGGYVEWAYEKGLVTGLGISSKENKPYFAPEQPISREAAASLLMNYCESIGGGPVGAWAIRLDYTDLDDISEWAGKGVMYSTLKGLITGYPDKTFRPAKTVTRAECAIIMDRFAEQGEKNTDDSKTK